MNALHEINKLVTYTPRYTTGWWLMNKHLSQAQKNIEQIYFQHVLRHRLDNVFQKERSAFAYCIAYILWIIGCCPQSRAL